MLVAFIAVIVLGICGTGTAFVLATRVSGEDFGPPWMVRVVEAEGWISAEDDTGGGAISFRIEMDGRAIAPIVIERDQGESLHGNDALVR